MPRPHHTVKQILANCVKREVALSKRESIYTARL